MTRLYTSVYCERCGTAHTDEAGVYFGKRLGDEHRTEELCFHCWMNDVLKERRRFDERKNSD